MKLLVDLLAAILDALAAVALNNRFAMIIWAVLFALFFIPFAIWWFEYGQYHYEKWW